MSDHFTDLQDGLKKFGAFFNQVNKRSAGLFSNAVKPELSFIDFAHNLRGADLAQQLWERRFAIRPDLYFRVHDCVMGVLPYTGYLRWSALWSLKSVTQSVNGMSEIGFDMGGGIISIHEFWENPGPLVGKKYAQELAGRPRQRLGAAARRRLLRYRE